MLFDPAKVFDRVVILNLVRREDRWCEMFNEFKRCDWPFKTGMPIIQAAIDGQLVEAPEGFEAGRNAWGCFQSHRRAIEDSINNKSQCVLIMEDDAIFCKDFREKSIDFMTRLQAADPDWEFAFLGGHHIEHPMPVAEGVDKIVKLDCLHAYAVRGTGLMALYRFWHQWHIGHCDHAISDWIGTRRAYCPNEWLVGQRAGLSDIARANENSEQLHREESWYKKGVNVPISTVAVGLGDLPCQYRGNLKGLNGLTPIFQCSLPTNKTGEASFWPHTENQPEPNCLNCLDRPIVK